MNNNNHSKTRLTELSDEGLKKWHDTLKAAEPEMSFHHGAEAERINSEWRPTLEDVEEELERRGLI
jgi:hypothetical protein